MRAKGDGRRPAWIVAPKSGASAPAQAGFGGEAGRAGKPKEECMKTILNTDRLKRLTARIPPRWADDISPATPPCPDVRIAQPAESVPRNSAPCRELSPASSELAVWRPIWRLHNKERARYENPLISANSHFSPLKCRVSVPDVARASRRAASASGPTSPRHPTQSTASKCTEVMAGLSRAAAVRWREMRANG